MYILANKLRLRSPCSPRNLIKSNRLATRSSHPRTSRIITSPYNFASMNSRHRDVTNRQERFRRSHRAIIWFLLFYRAYNNRGPSYIHRLGFNLPRVGFRTLYAQHKHFVPPQRGRERVSSRRVASRCSVTLSKHFLCPAVKTYLPGTYIYACVWIIVESRETYICMCVCVCTRMRGTAFSARGSSHDNPMGVSHRFRGIGFDCCYLDPADEDTRIHGVSQTYRALNLSVVITSPNLQSIIPQRLTKIIRCNLVKISISSRLIYFILFLIFTSIEIK